MPTRLYPAPEALDAELVRAWAAVSPTIAADLFRGRVLVDPAIRPLRPFGTSPRLAGRVVTAWCEPADYGPVQHAVAVAGPGDVILVDAGGRLDSAMIGDILGGHARRKGVAGLVVDGAVRDIGILASWPDFPVFARGNTARGPSSKERGAVNAPIVLGGIRVEPGDLVVGDDDGIVVIPPAEARARLAEAQAKVQAEVDWEARLRKGEPQLEIFGIPAGELPD